MNFLNGHTEDREHKTTVLLDAPLNIVWAMWTDPEHIRQWWGPDGFSSTIDEMQAETGGAWNFTMHGPDGKNYPNRTLFLEVIRHRKIVHEHYDPNFIAIIGFEPEGDRTRLSWHKVYETKELFDLVEIQYEAAKGFRQTLDRLRAYIAGNMARKDNT